MTVREFPIKRQKFPRSFSSACVIPVVVKNSLVFRLLIVRIDQKQQGLLIQIKWNNTVFLQNIRGFRQIIPCFRNRKAIAIQDILVIKENCRFLGC